MSEKRNMESSERFAWLASMVMFIFCVLLAIENHDIKKESQKWELKAYERQLDYANCIKSKIDFLKDQNIDLHQ